MIKYSPVNDEGAVERITYVKDGVTITLINTFDTYEIYVDEEEDDFDMESYDPDEGAEMLFVDEERGVITFHEVEGDLDPDEKQEIIESFIESFESGPEKLGWTWSDRELWFYGPITREKE